MKNKEIKIQKVIEESIKKVQLVEAEGDKVKDVFNLLDEARKALQDAQANIYIQMPNMYQQAYKTELDSIYNHCGKAIAEIQILAKRIHQETNI
jgi:hypothetical protein